MIRTALPKNRVRLAAALVAAGFMTGGPALGVAAATPGETDGSSSAGTPSPASERTGPARPRRVLSGATPEAPTGNRTRRTGSAPAAAVAIRAPVHTRATSLAETRVPPGNAADVPPANRGPSTPPAGPVNDLVAGAMLLTRRNQPPSDAGTAQTTNFTGWAVGTSNDSSGGYATILKIDTRNNGFSTVTRQGSAAQFADITLQGVATVSPRISWIAGLDNTDQHGVIFRTNDGGVTWKPQAVGQQLESLYGITAINRYEAWAVGEAGSVYFTRNAGRKWTQVGSPQDLLTNGALQGVFAPSFNGNGRVWVTQATDAQPGTVPIFFSPNTSVRYLPSIRWSGTSDTTTCSAECSMLSVTGNSTGRKLFAVGGKPYTVVASVDSGRHWMQQTLSNAGGTNDANSVVTLDGTNAWIVADYGNTWWTDNGGAQWNKVRVPGASGTFLLGVSTPDNRHLWAVGSEYGKGVIATSSDAGRTWEILGGEAIPDTGGLWKVSVVSNCALRR